MTADRDAAEALRYLEGLTRFGTRLGLERMERLLAALGHPERNLRVIHVAGTNGKGSTCALLAAVLQAAGYRVGLYTSPHLVRYEERIRLDGIPIRAEHMADILSHVRIAGKDVEARLGEHPTEFEVLTALAYVFFLESGVDLVVQEAGLGGRLDATNIFENPQAVILTPIQMDHRDILGSTLAEIAAEKAAIIKRGCPVVVARQLSGALRVIEEVLAECASPVIRIGREARLSVKDVLPSGTIFDYADQYRTYRGLRTSLLGRHQAGNAASAVAAVNLLRGHGYRVSKEAIYTGLTSADWPGRLERLSSDPEIVLDAAHNPAGARVLRQALREIYAGRRFGFVVGMYADKDVVGFLQELRRIPISLLVATSARGERALAADALAGIARNLQGRGLLPEGLKVAVEADPVAAVQAVLGQADPDQVTCVTGSLSVVGPVRQWFFSSQYTRTW